MNKNQTPLIVIFGRTNVGKSTLFNCLTEKKTALVSNVSGTTRDSNIGDLSWRGRSFRLVDTGGIENLGIMTANRRTQKKYRRSGDIETRVQLQARDYLLRADLILFLVDARDGLLPQDREMSLEIKKILPDIKKTDKIILVANKADSPRLRKETAEFNALGLGEPTPVSAANGSGTGDLLDIIADKTAVAAPEPEPVDSDIAETPEAERPIRVAIIGKPNVGKSSLVNKLLGEERVIVSPVPHTTREPQNIDITYQGRRITFIDTAGISKKGQRLTRHARIKNLEKFSIIKSLAVLKKADIALLVVDINEDLTHQESRLVEEIIVKTKTSLIIVANKWDLIKSREPKRYQGKIYMSLPFATWAPIHFSSALTGEKVKRIPDLILKVAAERNIIINDNALSKFLSKIVKKHLPSKAKGTKHPHIYALKQLRTNPPKFMVQVGAKDTIHFSYLHFIENRLREKFGFSGTPITIFVENGRRVHGKHELYITDKTKGF